MITNSQGTPRKKRRARRLGPITERQRATLNAVKEYIRARGYPPSRFDLARAIGVGSTQTVDVLLQRLAKRGIIELDACTIRGIRLVEPDQVPLIDLSKAAQDEGLICSARTIDHVPGRLADRFDPKPHCFVILDHDTPRAFADNPGDWLAVRTTTHAEAGEVVVARAHGAWTCTRLGHRDEGLRVAGVVIGVLGARALAHSPVRREDESRDETSTSPGEPSGRAEAPGATQSRRRRSKRRPQRTA